MSHEINYPNDKGMEKIETIIKEHKEYKEALKDIANLYYGHTYEEWESIALKMRDIAERVLYYPDLPKRR